jgi:hypothetical protein
VELTFETPPPLPKAPPETWLQLSASAAVVRFIDSRFDPDRTNQQIRSVLGETRDVTFTPMSLRSIFLAMAKAGRELAGSASEVSTTTAAKTTDGSETSGMDRGGT